MRLTELASARNENNTSSWGTSVWRSITMPALPPTRREQESRAAAFANRVLKPISAPALGNRPARG